MMHDVGYVLVLFLLLRNTVTAVSEETENPSVAATTSRSKEQSEDSHNNNSEVQRDKRYLDSYGGAPPPLDMLQDLPDLNTGESSVKIKRCRSRQSYHDSVLELDRKIHRLRQERLLLQQLQLQQRAVSPPIVGNTNYYNPPAACRCSKHRLGHPNNICTCGANCQCGRQPVTPFGNYRFTNLPNQPHLKQYTKQNVVNNIVTNENQARINYNAPIQNYLYDTATENNLNNVFNNQRQNLVYNNQQQNLNNRLTTQRILGSNQYDSNTVENLNQNIGNEEFNDITIFPQNIGLSSINTPSERDYHAKDTAQYLKGTEKYNILNSNRQSTHGAIFSQNIELSSINTPSKRDYYDEDTTQYLKGTEKYDLLNSDRQSNIYETTSEQSDFNNIVRSNNYYSLNNQKIPPEIYDDSTVGYNTNDGDTTQYLKGTAKYSDRQSNIYETTTDQSDFNNIVRSNNYYSLNNQKIPPAIYDDSTVGYNTNDGDTTQYLKGTAKYSDRQSNIYETTTDQSDFNNIVRSNNYYSLNNQKIPTAIYDQSTVGYNTNDEDTTQYLKGTAKYSDRPSNIYETTTEQSDFNNIVRSNNYYSLNNHKLTPAAIYDTSTNDVTSRNIYNVDDLVTEKFGLQDIGNINTFKDFSDSTSEGYNFVTSRKNSNRDSNLYKRSGGKSFDINIQPYVSSVEKFDAMITLHDGYNELAPSTENYEFDSSSQEDGVVITPEEPEDSFDILNPKPLPSYSHFYDKSEESIEDTSESIENSGNYYSVDTFRTPSSYIPSFLNVEMKPKLDKVIILGKPQRYNHDSRQKYLYFDKANYVLPRENGQKFDQRTIEMKNGLNFDDTDDDYNEIQLDRPIVDEKDEILNRLGIQYNTKKSVGASNIVNPVINNIPGLNAVTQQTIDSLNNISPYLLNPQISTIPSNLVPRNILTEPQIILHSDIKSPVKATSSIENDIDLNEINNENKSVYLKAKRSSVEENSGEKQQDNEMDINPNGESYTEINNTHEPTVAEVSASNENASTTFDEITTDTSDKTIDDITNYNENESNEIENDGSEESSIDSPLLSSPDLEEENDENISTTTQETLFTDGSDKIEMHTKFKDRSNPKYELIDSQILDTDIVFPKIDYPDVSNIDDSMETVFCQCHKFVQGKWIPFDNSLHQIPYSNQIEGENDEYSNEMTDDFIIEPTVMSEQKILLSEESYQSSTEYNQIGDMNDENVEDTLTSDFVGEMPEQITPTSQEADQINEPLTTVSSETTELEVEDNLGNPSTEIEDLNTESSTYDIMENEDQLLGLQEDLEVPVSDEELATENTQLTSQTSETNDIVLEDNTTGDSIQEFDLSTNQVEDNTEDFEGDTFDDQITTTHNEDDFVGSLNNPNEINPSKEIEGISTFPTNTISNNEETENEFVKMDTPILQDETEEIEIDTQSYTDENTENLSGMLTEETLSSINDEGPFLNSASENPNLKKSFDFDEQNNLSGMLTEETLSSINDEEPFLNSASENPNLKKSFDFDEQNNLSGILTEEILSSTNYEGPFLNSASENPNLENPFGFDEQNNVADFTDVSTARNEDQTEMTRYRTAKSSNEEEFYQPTVNSQEKDTSLRSVDDDILSTESSSTFLNRDNIFYPNQMINNNIRSQTGSEEHFKLYPFLSESSTENYPNDFEDIIKQKMIKTCQISENGCQIHGSNEIVKSTYEQDNLNEVRISNEREFVSSTEYNDIQYNIDHQEEAGLIISTEEQHPISSTSEINYETDTSQSLQSQEFSTENIYGTSTQEFIPNYSTERSAFEINQNIPIKSQENIINTDQFIINNEKNINQDNNILTSPNMVLRPMQNDFTIVSSNKPAIVNNEDIKGGYRIPVQNHVSIGNNKQQNIRNHVPENNFNRPQPNILQQLQQNADALNYNQILPNNNLLQPQINTLTTTPEQNALLNLLIQNQINSLLTTANLQQIPSVTPRIVNNNPLLNLQPNIPLIPSNNNKKYSINNQQQIIPRRSQAKQVENKLIEVQEDFSSENASTEQISREHLKISNEDSYEETSTYESTTSKSVQTLENPLKTIIELPEYLKNNYETTTQISLDEKLATTIRTVFGEKLGRIVPMSPMTQKDLSGSRMLFIGSNIRLPLIVSKKSDGSYQLSLDTSQICQKCNTNKCNANRGRICKCKQETEEIYSGSASTYEVSEESQSYGSTYERSEEYTYETEESEESYSKDNSLESSQYKDNDSETSAYRRAKRMQVDSKFNKINSLLNKYHKMYEKLKNTKVESKPKIRVERSALPQLENLLDKNKFLKKHFSTQNNAGTTTPPLDNSKEQNNEIISQTKETNIAETVKRSSQFNTGENLIHNENMFNSIKEHEKYPSVYSLTKYDDTLIPKHNSDEIRTDSSGNLHIKLKLPTSDEMDAEIIRKIIENEHMSKMDSNEIRHEMHRFINNDPHRNFRSGYHIESDELAFIQNMHNKDTHDDSILLSRLFQKQNNDDIIKQVELIQQMEKYNPERRLWNDLPHGSLEENRYKDYYKYHLSHSSSNHKKHKHHHKHKRHHDSSNEVKKKDKRKDKSSEEKVEKPKGTDCDEFVNEKLGLVRSLISWVRDWVTETAVKTKQAITNAVTA